MASCGSAESAERGSLPANARRMSRPHDDRTDRTATAEPRTGRRGTLPNVRTLQAMQAASGRVSSLLGAMAVCGRPPDWRSLARFLDPARQLAPTQIPARGFPARAALCAPLTAATDMQPAIRIQRSTEPRSAYANKREIRHLRRTCPFLICFGRFRGEPNAVAQHGLFPRQTNKPWGELRALHPHGSLYGPRRSSRVRSAERRLARPGARFRPICSASNEEEHDIDMCPAHRTALVSGLRCPREYLCYPSGGTSPATLSPRAMPAQRPGRGTGPTFTEPAANRRRPLIDAWLPMGAIWARTTRLRASGTHAQIGHIAGRDGVRHHHNTSTDLGQ